MFLAKGTKATNKPVGHKHMPSPRTRFVFLSSPFGLDGKEGDVNDNTNTQTKGGFHPQSLNAPNSRSTTTPA